MLGITDGAKQLASIDITHLQSDTVDMNRIRKRHAPDFGSFFNSLVDVITRQDKKLRARQASQQVSTPISSGSPIPTQKRPPPIPVSDIPAKRTRQTDESASPRSEPKTPDQPTHPSDPDWTGGTDSSKDEEHAKMLLRDLLMNTKDLLAEDFYRITWQRSGHKVDIVQTFSRIFNLLTYRHRNTTKFRLGMQTIIAINDGGLGVRYNTGEGPVDWQPGGIRPVLALEVLISALLYLINSRPNEDAPTKRTT